MADIIRDAVRQEAARHTFRAWMRQEGRYWVIRIPIIDGITQARTKREAELMAKDLVAVTLDIPTAEAKVEMLEGIPEDIEEDMEE